MRNWIALRERCLRDPTSIRLGNLASTLARPATALMSQSNPAMVEGLLEESKHFIEWATPEARLEVQVPLVELQRLLIHWQGDWNQKKTGASWRQELAVQARAWSDRTLEMSGLLEEATAAD